MLNGHQTKSTFRRMFLPAECAFLLFCIQLHDIQFMPGLNRNEII